MRARLLKSLSARLEESRTSLEQARLKGRLDEETIASLKESIGGLKQSVKELELKRKVCQTCSHVIRDEIAPKPEKPMGVGMRITDTAPHRVVELLPTGAAARSKKIALQDTLVAVDGLQVCLPPTQHVTHESCSLHALLVVQLYHGIDVSQVYLSFCI